MSTVDEHLGAIDEAGYTILPDVFDAARAAAIRDQLDALEQQRGLVPGTNLFEGFSTVRIYNLLIHGPLFEDIATDPTVLAVVEGVLDAGCLVSSLSSISIGPGEVSQPIHADDQLMPLAKPHVPTVCNTMWALTDFTADNGATRVIPGSHRADHNPDFGKHYDSIPAEMSAGSVLVWHGSLWHGGGANTTDQSRVGVAMNYCAGWIRQQENQQLGIPIETVARFAPRLQELCGFGVYFGLIGHIERRSPRELLAEPESP